ncbi:hypothetical protein [Streptomyces sp. NPDC048057]|uniref:hypothetical protein n=1 Tax=Streptomyces sp. NPDC048057 TaxID=3155628 RepID=UPI003405840C
MDEIDERFNRWAERLRVLYADENATQDDLEVAYDEMWIEDKNLIAYWDNCIDGCCPTGALLLARLVHPRISAPAMVRVFPEFIKSSRTHRAVIYTAED